ncbi:carbon-nitrogen hydrolase family protein [Microbacterium gorillae]|uniref:carbon-nitrogen hydrolase family protein n=1 Tax=Microbacterium gorillae TaxID=1231063 RepID=UPI00059153F6|nr:carbon-nitrogen hydrolase family protein [Microbacterium gorillae]
MSEILVAVAQFAPGPDDNLPVVRDLVSRAARRGARLVVLPEYASWFANPFPADLAAHAESLDGPFVAALTEVAAGSAVTVVAGMLEAAGDGRAHNTVVAVDAGGLRARYRKVHLYDAFGQRESDLIAPGAPTDPETFDVDGMRFGLMTCYDLRFPESARALVDAGADVLLVPAEWVRGPLKEDHWETLLRARAIENTVYVLAADHTPPVGVGRSAVIDPSGILLASLGTEAGVAVAAVGTEEIGRVRAVNPALELRRYRVTPRD